MFIELKGGKGIIGKTRLFHKPEGVKSNSYLYEPPFSFKPGSEETFTIRAPDIGDLKLLNVEVILAVALFVAEFTKHYRASYADQPAVIRVRKYY